MLKAYVAGPYGGKTSADISNNISNASRVAQYLWKNGYNVLCPHMNSAHYGGIVEEKVFLDAYLEWLELCDLVVLAPRWFYSSGTRKEVVRAVVLNIPIFFYAEDRGCNATIYPCKDYHGLFVDIEYWNDRKED